MAPSKVQLRCQQCVKSKKKCDKATPCSTCVEKGLSCSPVERKRLPRGRSSKGRAASKVNLHDRIAALEAVVQNLKVKSQPTNGHIDSNARESHKSESPQVATEFWENLIDALSHMQDVLRDDQDEDDRADPQQDDVSEVADESIVLFRNDNLPTNLDETLVTLSIESQLVDLYMQRFHPLMWVLDSRDIYDTRIPEDGDISPMHAAILFGASVTLLPSDGLPKARLIDHCRKLCEYRMRRAGLLTTRDLKVLQSFVVYLAALRGTRAHKEQWTLMPLALRIATTFNLGRLAAETCHLSDDNEARLWHCIGVLDLQTSFDRGSKPLMTAQDFDLVSLKEGTIDPDNVDMEEFDDMSPSLLIYRATLCQRRLLACTTNAMQNPVTQRTWWLDQKAILANFRYNCTIMGVSAVDETQSTLQQFTALIAQESLITMQLLMHRPLQALPSYLRPPPGDTIDILDTAIRVLDNAQYKLHPEFMQWSWFTWVKWYVLAIALAEFCRLPKPWPWATGRAWMITETAYEQYSQLVSDVKGGLLWRPIKRLYVRAKRQRQGQSHLNDDGSMTEDTVLGADVANDWTNWLPVDMKLEEWNSFLDDMIDPTLWDLTKDP